MAQQKRQLAPLAPNRVAENKAKGSADADSVRDYLEAQGGLDMLRFITCGSVDDGKSTLIGRMLYEAQMVFDDQVAALEADSKKSGTQGGDIDFALLVDGLAAEREQGITIDVAYRFFNTDRRKFIVADTPGHEQYTRNMVTGASTADVAVILLDASQGVLTQTRRHSFIASLLGIRHVVLAVNKMDLVDFDEATFTRICGEYAEFAQQLNFTSITPIPLSALQGDNVIQRSERTGWHSGPTLLGFLETVAVREDIINTPMRMPIQWVNRPNANFRGYAGTLAAGQIAPGDDVRVLPSGHIAKVEQVLLADQVLPRAIAQQAVTVVLDREVDVSRGDLLVQADEPCEVSDQFDVSIVWMSDEPCFVGRSYWLMLGANRVNATLTEIKFKYNINTLEELSSRTLELNDVGRASLNLDKALPFESFATNPQLGSFVLIDRYTHATVGAGMLNFALRRSQNVHRQAMVIDRNTRAKLNGHRGKVLWFTGLSGSGKSTIADATEQELHSKGIRTYVLDGDNVRHGLNKDLGFTETDRIENIRRVAEVAKLMVDAGLVVLTAFISPFRSERDMARSLFDEGDFVEIFVDVPLSVAEERDPKGLYRKARQGELPNFTGIDSAYEPPTEAEVHLASHELEVSESVALVLKNVDLL